jgi:hypothetical protein
MRMYVSEPTTNHVRVVASQWPLKLLLELAIAPNSWLAECPLHESLVCASRIVSVSRLKRCLMFEKNEWIALPLKYYP